MPHYFFLALKKYVKSQNSSSKNYTFSELGFLDALQFTEGDEAN